MKPYPTLGLLHISSYLRRRGLRRRALRHHLRPPRRPRWRASPRARRRRGHLHQPDDPRPVLDLVAGRQGPRLDGGAGRPRVAPTIPTSTSLTAPTWSWSARARRRWPSCCPPWPQRGPHRLHGIAGTVFRDEAGAVVHNPERAQIADLDTLPWPDRERIDQQRYVDVWRTPPRHGKRQPDHRPRLPLQVPLVLPRRVRLHPPPAQRPGRAPTSWSTSAIASSPTRSGTPTTSSPSATAGSSTTRPS